MGQAESGGAERFSPSNRVARKREREEACLVLSAPSSVRASSFYQRVVLNTVGEGRREAANKSPATNLQLVGNYTGLFQDSRDPFASPAKQPRPPRPPLLLWSRRRRCPSRCSRLPRRSRFRHAPQCLAQRPSLPPRAWDRTGTAVAAVPLLEIPRLHPRDRPRRRPRRPRGCRPRCRRRRRRCRRCHARPSQPTGMPPRPPPGLRSRAGRFSRVPPKAATGSPPPGHQRRWPAHGSAGSAGRPSCCSSRG